MIFLVRFTVLDNTRSDCMLLFGGMSASDDYADLGEDVTLLGRWCVVGASSGYCVCKTKSTLSLNQWLLGWSLMANIEVVPVVDDNEARAILMNDDDLKYVAPDMPDLQTFNTPEDEGMFAIDYKFRDSRAREAYELFSQMNERDNTDDVGANTLLARWHDLGSGTGLIICTSRSSAHLQEWASHWIDLCTFKILPIVTGEEFRKAVTAIPDFKERHAQVKARANVKRGLFGWW